MSNFLKPTEFLLATKSKSIAMTGIEKEIYDRVVTEYHTAMVNSLANSKTDSEYNSLMSE